MKEFTLNNVEYRAKKICAMEQLHIARRLSPFLPSLLKIVHGVKNTGQEGERDDLTLGLEAFTEIISKMSNEEAEYIIHSCLEAVERKQNNTWAPVRKNGVTMFEITLPELLQMSWHVLEDNLSAFFPELPSRQDIAKIVQEKGMTL